MLNINEESENSIAICEKLFQYGDGFFFIKKQTFSHKVVKYVVNLINRELPGCFPLCTNYHFNSKFSKNFSNFK